MHVVATRTMVLATGKVEYRGMPNSERQGRAGRATSTAGMNRHGTSQSVAHQYRSVRRPRGHPRRSVPVVFHRHRVPRPHALVSDERRGRDTLRPFPIARRGSLSGQCTEGLPHGAVRVIERANAGAVTQADQTSARLISIRRARSRELRAPEPVCHAPGP